jgi:hypothetical protein
VSPRTRRADGRECRDNRGLFGVPLAAALKEHVEAGFKVPPFIEQVCLHIEQTMLHTQGMFRLAANAEALEKCRNALNDGIVT